MQSCFAELVILLSSGIMSSFQFFSAAEPSYIQCCIVHTEDGFRWNIINLHFAFEVLKSGHGEVQI